MRQALLLHALFIVLMCVLGLIRVRYYRRQRKVFGLRFASQGKTLNEIRQLAAVVALLVMLVHTINPNILSWTELPLPYLVRWLGGAVAIVAVALLAKAADAATEGSSTDDPLPLRTEGPYALVRHPLDATIALTAAALTILSANWVVGLIGGAMAAHALLVRARRDDEQLRLAYGAAYDDYAARTPPFLPRLRASRAGVAASRGD